MSSPIGSLFRPSNPTPYHPNNIHQSLSISRILTNAGFKNMKEFMEAQGLSTYENEPITRAWEMIDGMREDEIAGREESVDRWETAQEDQGQDGGEESGRKKNDGEESVGSSSGIMNDADEGEEFSGMLDDLVVLDHDPRARETYELMTIVPGGEEVRGSGGNHGGVPINNGDGYAHEAGCQNNTGEGENRGNDNSNVGAEDCVECYHNCDNYRW
ncbi:hypothetical protein NHQ30_009438 [Ciborinia camelliae]|nr:hypothetical protein NHQ30_009438 [Ciborinia camelliae]